MLLSLLSSAGWACICVPRPISLTPPEAPRNARMVVVLPARLAENFPVTAYRLDDGPWRRAATGERTSADTRIVTLSRHRWPAGTGLTVARGNEKEWTIVAKTRITGTVDHTPPAPEGTVTGRRTMFDDTCSNGNAALQIQVPADPDVAVWGIWVEGANGARPDLHTPTWLRRPSVVDGVHTVRVGSTMCGEGERDFEETTVVVYLVPFDAAGNRGEVRRERLEVPSVWVYRRTR